MIVRERNPAGVPNWIELTTPDPAAAADFYGRVLGWQVGGDGVARRDGHVVAAIAPVGEGSWPSGWHLYVAVDDAARAAGQVTASGGRVLGGPATDTSGAPIVRCADPAGAVFGLRQAPDHRGAEMVNGDGSWNFNELATPDPAGAEAFYGALLGWKAEPFDFGTGGSWLWIRPGYGRFLAELDPEIRQRHEEAGAPDSFSDAVAWLRTADGEPAAWDTTFAVDDPDAVAGTAADRGAEVLVAPHDVGVVRMAVLRDPHGAAFTVSRYQPG